MPLLFLRAAASSMLLAVLCAGCNLLPDEEKSEGLITSQPGDDTVTAGSWAYFQVGTESLDSLDTAATTYRWTVNGAAVDSAVDGRFVLPLGASLSRNGAKIQVTVTREGRSVRSRVATLTVRPLLMDPVPSSLGRRFMLTLMPEFGIPAFADLDGIATHSADSSNGGRVVGLFPKRESFRFAEVDIRLSIISLIGHPRLLVEREGALSGFNGESDVVVLALRDSVDWNDPEGLRKAHEKFLLRRPPEEKHYTIDRTNFSCEFSRASKNCPGAIFYLDRSREPFGMGEEHVLLFKTGEGRYGAFTSFRTLSEGRELNHTFLLTGEIRPAPRW